MTLAKIVTSDTLHVKRYSREAFVQGATAAATGALAGAVIVLASRAIYDVPTAAIARASLAVLWRFKIPTPVLVAAAGAIGLVVRPLM